MDSSPIWMLGKKHECTSSTKERDDTTTLTSIEQKKDSFPSFVSDFESRIWCTYRKDFPVIPGSFYTSDMGWGCMHRTAQMTLAQAFLSHYLGRDWEFSKHKNDIPKIYYEILQWFSDDEQSPYSVHNISMIGILQNKAVGEWYGPSTVACAMRELVSKNHGTEFATYVSDNGMVYEDEVNELCGGQEWNKSVIIMIPVRLGVETIPDSYHNVITTLFQYPQSLGMAGGKPKSSLYFVGVQGDSLFYLDPHVVFNKIDMTTIPFDTSSYNPQQINNIKISQIDPSFAATFYCHDRNDFENFCTLSEKFQEDLNGEHIFAVTESRHNPDDSSSDVDISWPGDSVILDQHIDIDTEIDDFVIL